MPVWILATIVLKKYLNKIRFYKVKYTRNDRTAERYVNVQKMMNNIPFNLVKVSSAKAVYIYLSKL